MELKEDLMVQTNPYRRLESEIPTTRFVEYQSITVPEELLRVVVAEMLFMRRGIVPIKRGRSPIFLKLMLVLSPSSLNLAKTRRTRSTSRNQSKKISFSSMRK